MENTIFQTKISVLKDKIKKNLIYLNHFCSEIITFLTMVKHFFNAAYKFLNDEIRKKK